MLILIAVVDFVYIFYNGKCWFLYRYLLLEVKYLSYLFDKNLTNEISYYYFVGTFVSVIQAYSCA